MSGVKLMSKSLPHRDTARGDAASLVKRGVCAITIAIHGADRYRVKWWAFRGLYWQPTARCVYSECFPPLTTVFFLFPLRVQTQTLSIDHLSLQR